MEKNFMHVAKMADDTFKANNTAADECLAPRGDRGKRGERFGLLLDEGLKKDLFDLSKASGSKSVNDYIVTALIEHVEREECQKRLGLYRALLKQLP